MTSIFLNILGQKNLNSSFIYPDKNGINIVLYLILSSLLFIKKFRISFKKVILIYVFAVSAEFAVNLFFSDLPYYVENLIACGFIIIYFVAGLLMIETVWSKLLYVFLITLNYKALINAVKKIVFNSVPEGQIGNQIVISIIGLFLSLAIYILIIKKLKFQIEFWKSEICNTSMALFLLFFLFFSSVSGTGFVNQADRIKCALLIIIIALIQAVVCYLIDRLLIKANETELLKQQLRMLNVKISEQEELFKDFENSIKEIKETKHNLRHQLLLIKEYIDTDDKEHLLEYLDKIQYPLSKNIGPALCKNRTANAVISHYVKIAQEESIEVSLNLQLPEVMNICDEDLCVIFGNCLENAVEACRRMKSGQRYIHLSALYKGNFLAITLDNSFDGKIIKKDNTFFSRKREHEEGIGISTIRSVVRKYNGMAEFKYSQNQFETSIFLNCQSNQHSQMTICRTQNTYS